MKTEVGQVVRSIAGHDNGSLLMVVAQQDGYVMLCDGKERRLEKPKRKNVRHIAHTGMRLDPTKTATNRSLKKALAQLQRDEATEV